MTKYAEKDEGRHKEVLKKWVGLHEYSTQSDGLKNTGFINGKAIENKVCDFKKYLFDSTKFRQVFMEGLSKF